MKIDKGIPIPPKPGAFKPKYPFREMQIGDSFFMAFTDGKKEDSRIRACAKYAQLILNPAKFTCRTVTENGVEGLRTWRTK